MVLLMLFAVIWLLLLLLCSRLVVLQVRINFSTLRVSNNNVCRRGQKVQNVQKPEMKILKKLLILDIECKCACADCYVKYTAEKGHYDTA